MNVPSYLNQRQLPRLGVKNRTEAPWKYLFEQFVCYSQDEHIVENHLGVEIPPFGCEFSKAPGSHHILAIADEEGFIKLINTNKISDFALVKEWAAHSNAVFDLAWTETEPKLLTASGDQTSILWDVEKCCPVSLFAGHQSTIKSVNFRRHDDNVFVSGGRDGSVMIWDTRSKGQQKISPSIVISDAHVSPSSSAGHIKSVSVRKKKVFRPKGRNLLGQRDYHKSVTCALFQTDQIVISAGASDNVIKLWDIRKISSASKKQPNCLESFPYAGVSQRQHGFSSIILDSTCSRLFASCTDDIIYVYSCVNFNKEPICVFQGHSNSSFYVRSALSQDDRFLLSGSSDGQAYIWDVSKPHNLPYILTGHTKEVTSVTWSPQDITELVTCSDDSTVRVWRIDRNSERRKHCQIVGKCEVSKSYSTTTRSPSLPPGSSTSSGLISIKGPVRNGSMLSFVTVRQSVDREKMNESTEEEEKENVHLSENEQQSLESGYGSLEIDKTPCKQAKTNEHQRSVGSSNISKKLLKPVTISHLLQQRHKAGNGCHGKQCSPHSSSSSSVKDEESHETGCSQPVTSHENESHHARTIFHYFSPK